MTNKRTKEIEIIKAASIKFCSTGFAKTNIQGIADCAGIGKGTIYEYFDSKEDLFVEVINYNHEIYLNNLKEAIHSVHTFTDKLEKYFQFNKKIIEINIKKIELIFTNEFFGLSSNTKNKIKDSILSLRNKLIKIIEEILVLAEKNESIVIVNKNFVADIFIEMVFRTCIRFVQMNIDEKEQQKEKETLFNILLKGISK